MQTWQHWQFGFVPSSYTRRLFKSLATGQRERQRKEGGEKERERDDRGATRRSICQSRRQRWRRTVSNNFVCAEGHRCPADFEAVSRFVSWTGNWSERSRCFHRRPPTETHALDKFQPGNAWIVVIGIIGENWVKLFFSRFWVSFFTVSLKICIT